jgi:Cu(I)/Ag(I) efflux system membrane fusion protein
VVDYVYPELDATTRTLPVRLRFDNSEGLLRPNMFGTVSLIPSSTRMALTVPSEAIIRTGAAERVILKTGDGTFKPRLITTGLRDNFGEGGRTEVVQGLAPGEEVVASAQFLIDSESALSAGLMRMAPTDEAPARGTGELIALDAENRSATIRHAALDALDWPAMTSRFPLRADIPLGRLAPGQQVAFRAARGADGLLSLIALGSDDGVAATGTGTVMAVTADGKLTLSHDPIPELGWPSMQMDMPVAGVDLAAVPLDQPVEFDLSKGEDGLFTIVAVRGGAMPAPEPMEAAIKEPPALPMEVSGTINAVDTAAGVANITHGPMMDIGMPGMTMDFAIDPTVDVSALPEGEDVTLLLVRNPDFSMTLVGVAAASGVSQ